MYLKELKECLLKNSELNIHQKPSLIQIIKDT